MKEDCKQTSHTSTGHLIGCGLCNACIQAEEHERKQEDILFKLLATSQAKVFNKQKYEQLKESYVPPTTWK